jgi:PAS domain S-box-containing protein
MLLFVNIKTEQSNFMKTFLRHRFNSLRKNILYGMSFCFFVLLFFILFLFQSAGPLEHIFIAIAGAVVAFVFVLFFLFKIDLERESGKIAKNDLAVNELKYTKLIENAGIVMYTTSLDGYITFATEKSVQLTEYPMDELIGMHFSDIIDIEWLELALDKYKRQVEKNIEETLFEFAIRTKFGDLKWVEQTAVLMVDNDKITGFQCVIKDISEKREMENVLRNYEIVIVQNQERLQSILDNATSLIYVKDLEGKYLLVNKQFKQVLNVTESEIIGKTDFDFTDPAQAQLFKETDDKVLSTCKPVELEIIIGKEGKNHTLLITKFPLVNAQNKVYGISGIATDISERVSQLEELKEAKKIAESAKNLQEQFLANMSHEIRTPMNGIQGMVDLLLDTPLTENQHDFAKTIKKSADNLVVIINDILDFSKIKAGKLTIEKIDFNLNEVIQNISAVFSHKLNEKNLDFSIHLDNDIPATLQGDPYRLNQILINLIGNAIKFTHKGSVSLTVNTEKKNAEGVLLTFSVADTGIGIKKDKIEEIFESFTQASVETSRKYGGSGLGLAITRQLLQLQQSDISVESEENKGATFHFSILFGYSKANRKLFFKGKKLKDYHDCLQGRKFLVAEDNEVNQKVIENVLKKAGAGLDIANNGLEAINFLKQNTSYDMIIMDLQMPEMDGYAATKYIRNVMDLSIPIIAMTASALKGEKSKCIEIGMNDYFTKPFEFSHFYEQITNLLSQNNMHEVTGEAAPVDHAAQFDLSMLQELDDNEYLSQMIEIFLSMTPAELAEMEKQAEAGELENVYKIAHKLKSSTGLMKANLLLETLMQIEQEAKNKNKANLKNLIADANKAFYDLEHPLRQELNRIKTLLKVA